MKNLKRVLTVVLVCAFIMTVFSACHSHSFDKWRIDKDTHWKECECGEISEKGEHNFELDICTVCGAERKLEDGVLTDMTLYNEYGDWIQALFFDEEEKIAGDSSAEYTYDKDGNKLTDELYEDGIFVSSGDYELDSSGFAYKKYDTEFYEDGTKCVYEYNENGDNLGYVVYDEDDNPIESYRSEYITDENGELIGEKVYENDVLTKEMKYVAASNEEEEYLYISEMMTYMEDGSKAVEIYDENGDIVKELLYNADGTKAYEYDIEYFFDEEGELTSIEKREEGVLKQEIIYEYDEEGNLTAEKTYEGDRLIKESQYTVAENYSYESKVIIYNEDGTTTVEEYDEYGEAIA